MFFNDCLLLAKKLNNAGIIAGSIEPKYILADLKLYKPKLVIAPREYLTKIDTYAYLAPERVAKLTQYSNQSDVYSIALAFMRILDGSVDMTDFIKDKTKRTSELNNTNNLVNRVSGILYVNGMEKVSASIIKALQFEPSKRHSSIAQFQSEFYSQAQIRLMI